MGSLQDRFMGCVLGLAIGDALGYPAEFRSRAQILASLGPQGITDFLPLQGEMWVGGPFIAGQEKPPGTYTDDTQMSLAVAEALCAAGEFELDVVMEAMADRFVQWSESPENDRAPGNTCMTACARLKSGMSWREAGVQDSKGCGAAMRTAPIGLYYHDRSERLAEIARASSLITHGHSAAVEGAFATAFLVAEALRGRTPEQMYHALSEATKGRSHDFTDCLSRVPSLVTEAPALAIPQIGEAWVAEEAVACALYCFWRSPDDFAQVMHAAVNTDGDSDSIACIAGAICGAYIGHSRLPAHWVRGVENQARLHRYAEDLFAAHAKS